MQLVQIRPSEPPRAFAESAPLLVDRAARQVKYLRISLTDRCNFRCTYCMPARGIEHVPRREVLTLEEIVAVVRAFAGWGVERVRLTGGEPTLRKGLGWLVERLVSIAGLDRRPIAVVMTTNGARLPELADELARAGLAGLTVSLDSLDGERFARVTRGGRLDRVLAGLDAAERAGFRGIKLNTVAVRGFNDDELGALARFAWDRAMIPRFIEVMPMASGELFVPGELCPAAEIRQRIEEELGARLVADPGEGVRGHGPASYWRVTTGSYAGRRLGTIGALTENFCAACNRLRISATGQIHGCLARDDAADLRAAVRSGRPERRLLEVVARVLAGKRDGHGFRIDGTGGPAKAMISIGG